MQEIETNLGTLRRARGISAILLAKSVGVSRQTIYAMEAGTFVPNTAVALRLARALGTSVEELFALMESAPAAKPRAERATLLPGVKDGFPGQPVQLCRVDRRLIASAPEAVPWYLPAADAVTVDKAHVQMFDADNSFANRILVAGCDPGISVLSRHVQAAGIDLVLAHRNSSQSLSLLKEGYVHIAGTHLKDNLPEIHRRFARNSVAVVTFAVWEEGLVTARKNPKGIRDVADLARRDVTIINRETGSGSRALLDLQLKEFGIQASAVPGYASLASGHLAAAWSVHSGAADCCLATRAAARAFGLHFIPLVTERYDLVIRKRHFELPRIQNLLETLSRSGLRRELEGLGGYDTRVTGQRVL